MDGHSPGKQTDSTESTGLIARWQSIPLYGRIVIALGLGVLTGLLMGSEAAVLAVPGSSSCVSSGHSRQR